MNTGILVVEGLSKSFGGIAALKGVSFRVKIATLTLLVGPNGSGKSTLINVITGTLGPDSGSIVFRGTELIGKPASVISRLGIRRTFQHILILSELTVTENLLIASPEKEGETLVGALLKTGSSKDERRRRERVDQMLDFLGIPDKANERVSTLSFGQLKLLSLGCCLIAEPEVVLLDEPISGLQSDMAQRMIERFTYLRQQGKTLLIVEHNLSDLEQVADQTLALDRGRLIDDYSALR